MENALVRSQSLLEAAQVADFYTRSSAFDQAKAELAKSTQNAYKKDLKTWNEYLTDAGVKDLADCDWFNDPSCWKDVSFGLVNGFKMWLLNKGYAVRTVNRKLACVRKFCSIARDAGYISPEQMAYISTVKLLKMEHDANTGRTANRVGDKKTEANVVSRKNVTLLKSQPNTEQGIRDQVIMCLLFDHGLRVSEVADLKVEDIDLDAGTMKFYRRKVKKKQTHELTGDTMRALFAYRPYMPLSGYLLRSTDAGGALTKPGMSVAAIAARVQKLGRSVGIDNLSPHDARHTWATSAQRQGTDPLVLQVAGGWESLQTVRKYVQENAIANEGVKLPY